MRSDIETTVVLIIYLIVGILIGGMAAHGRQWARTNRQPGVSGWEMSSLRSVPLNASQ
jgi:hypothetical protein